MVSLDGGFMWYREHLEKEGGLSCFVQTLFFNKQGKALDFRRAEKTNNNNLATLTNKQTNNTIC